ncbi:MAG: M28 family peptidase [Anaerolineales bacterium]
MITNQQPATFFAQRALSHIQVLARNGRGSATEVEKQAADYVQVQLTEIGVEDVHIQPFLGLRSIWLFFALAFGLALVGHAAYWFLRQPLGNLPALLVSMVALGVSGYLLWRKFTFRDFPLRTTLPHAPSQNVVAVIPPIGEMRKRLVLVAHLDSHRAVFWFATDLLVMVFAIAGMVCIYGVFLAIPLYILAVLTHVQVFAWLGLFLGAFHFLGWFTGVTADLGQYSPGANDNASAMGTVLALAERLKGQPLQNTEVWLAFTGCEETGCDGMLALLKQNGDQLKEALFVDFELVGIGDSLSYITVEGNLHRRTIPADVQALVKEIGEPYGLHPVATPLIGASTEGGTLWEFGYKAVCFSAHHQGSPILPEWHRLTDTPDHIQLGTLERVHALAWDLLHRFDQ